LHFFRNWITGIKATAPLLLLGFIRLVTTSGVDYQVKKLLRFCLKYFSFYKILISLVINYMQVHVTEYGVHWNFFFTLAAISILTSFVNIPAKYCGLLGFAVLAGIFQFHFLFFLNYKIVKPNYLQLPWFSGYQTWLLSGLNTYLLSDERGTDIISKNKEGVYSILGKILTWFIYYSLLVLPHLTLF